uniref:Uncharacterized protein n=1 Tax=Arundo donax TaxID=35708 RepID=A0A0A9CAW5_ARUDO
MVVKLYCERILLQTNT